MAPPPASAGRSKPTLRSSVALLASLALLAACSGPIAAIQLVLGTGGVVVLRGGSVDVAVVLTRSGGASGPVALAVTGLPAHVTAAFAPSTLDGAAVDSVLTLSATAAAIEAMPTLTVVATGGAVRAEATLDLAVESLAIGGQVVGAFAYPMAGVTVASQGRTTVTDATGAFDLDGLSIPYELVLSTTFSAGGVHVFEGLTTAAPVLTPVFALDGGTPTGRAATVSGDVLGGMAIAAERSVRVCVEGLDHVARGCIVVASGGTAYSLGVDWYGSTVTPVRVHALHMQTGADNRPVAYLGYEVFDLSLTDGVTYLRDLSLTPVATVVVEGSVAAAGAGMLDGTLGSVRFGPRLSMPVFASPAVVGDVSVLMPAPPGATYDLTAVVDGVGGTSLAWTVDRGTDFGTLTAPVPLTQVAPADAAVGVGLTTPFSSSGNDNVRTYLFEGTGPTLALSTTRTSVTVPNPALGGFAFPAGATYTWYVLGHGTADPDAALHRSILDYVLLFSVLTTGGPGFDQDGSFSIGTDRGFTFAP